MSVLALQRQHLPNPTVTRGQTVPFGTDAAGKMFAYATGGIVTIRLVNDPTQIVHTQTIHGTAAVTAVRLSPNGAFCASGDAEGAVKVWYTDPNVKQLPKEFHAFGGAVRDIAWSADNERLAVVGNGRDTFGVVISATMGSSMGNLTGPTREITACDFRKERPFRVAAGSADSSVNFYEGPPFQYKSSRKDDHKNAVGCVKFSPNGAFFASVSGSNEIVLQDGKTGELVRKIDTQHKGTVYAVTWSADSSTLVTASADKTVRSFSVDGAPGFTTTLGTDAKAMQLGVMTTAEGYASINLQGDLTLFAPDGTQQGVQRGLAKAVQGVAVQPDGSVIAASFDGRVLRFGADGAVTTVQGPDMSYVAAVGTNGNVLAFAGGEATMVGAGESYAAGPNGKAAAVAVLGGGEVVVGLGKTVAVFRGTEQIAKADIAKSVTALAAAQNTVIATSGEATHVFAFSGTALTQNAVLAASEHHRSDVKSLAVSDDGQLVATGDSTSTIVVWEAASGKAAFTDLYYHTAGVRSLAFAPHNSSVLVSGSADNCIIRWQLDGATRVKVENAHFGAVTAVAFDRDASNIISGGGDGRIKRWRLE